MPRSTVLDDCMLCVCFCQAAALLGVGQCKQFYTYFLGLLKRANYAKQNKHIEKSWSHLHKCHETSRLCGMEGLVCRAAMSSARIQVFQGHLVAEFVLILENVIRNKLESHGSESQIVCRCSHKAWWKVFWYLCSLEFLESSRQLKHIYICLNTYMFTCISTCWARSMGKSWGIKRDNECWRKCLHDLLI